MDAAKPRIIALTLTLSHEGRGDKMDSSVCWNDDEGGEAALN
jgi:hypothetical protein